ncbi:TPA: hypothetical protein DIC38_03330 [Candidatus Nomurabacteria bacterium]|nr:MAG: integral membrane protein MviN [Parcubacteria bacterium RAAC4_OD1_1]HCY26682.1 hypothetical protein [Candidatus Nomurabacteria bacterium]
MTNRVLKFLNREFKGINEAALLLGGFAFLSQILGLIRDRMLAQIVGVGETLDVYYAAFRIPDFLYISIASLASVTVLMPFLIEKIGYGGNNIEAKKFLNNIFTAYVVFMVGISLIIFLLMPYLANIIAPGFNDVQIKMLINISRIMLLSPIFIGLSNLIGTVTQIFKNFLVFSLSPVFYNLGIILGIIFLYRFLGIYGLGIGVIVGAFLHFIIQVPVVLKHGFFPRFISNIDWKEVLKVVKTSLPRTLTLSSNSLAFLVLIAIASSFEKGAISLFTFSYNLQSVPVGIIGISYSVAAFPILVKSFSIKDMDNFIKHIIIASKQIIFWSLPVMFLFIVLRAQIVRVVLGTNSFSWADTRLTSASVAIFVISLITQSLVLLFVRGYYATGNTKKPLFINMFSSLIIIIFAYFLMWLFSSNPYLLEVLENLLRVENVSGTIMFILPISYVLGSIINLILIWISFKKDFLKDYNFKVISKTFFDSLLGSIVIGVVSYLSLGIFDDIFDVTTGYGIFLQGFVSGSIGILYGIFVLYLIKNREIRDLFVAIKNKFWKNRIVAPEQIDL